MKTFKIFGYQIRFFFSVRRIKRLTFNLPDWADDTHITTVDADDKSFTYKIKYYKGSTPFYIDLPKCNDAVMVYLTPYSIIIDGKKVNMTNRKIIIDILY
jgi:hypothetical protein